MMSSRSNGTILSVVRSSLRLQNKTIFLTERDSLLKLKFHNGTHCLTDTSVFFGKRRPVTIRRKKLDVENEQKVLAKIKELHLKCTDAVNRILDIMDVASDVA